MKIHNIDLYFEVRKPILYNETGKQKFIFCYDPARNFDNSVLAIFELCESKEIGYYLKVANVISMVDTKSAKKTPLPMPDQIEIIKEQMILYNGEKANDWDNIEIFIDSGAGGGGISAVADNLLADWKDKQGNRRKKVLIVEQRNLGNNFVNE